MTIGQVCGWEDKQTAESRMVREVLLRAGFTRVDAYRYNSASLRVRVIDARFETMPRDERDSLVEPHIEQLPETTQSDIVNLVLLSPSEFEQPEKSFREWMQNLEFEHPSPSML